MPRLTGVSTASRNMPSAKPTMQRGQTAPAPFSRFMNTPRKNTAKIGGAEIALDALQVVVEPAAPWITGIHSRPIEDHHHGRDAADPDELRLVACGRNFE